MSIPTFTITHKLKKVNKHCLKQMELNMHFGYACIFVNKHCMVEAMCCSFLFTLHWALIDLGSWWCVTVCPTKIYTHLFCVVTFHSFMIQP